MKSNATKSFKAGKITGEERELVACSAGVFFKVRRHIGIRRHRLAKSG